MNLSNRKFIFHDLKTIDGYIDPPDALVFLSVLQHQNDELLTGGIAEIGVFYGRSYYLFRKICGPDQKILGIDLFDIGQADDHVSSQYGRFLENGRRLGLAVDERLMLKGDSTQLGAASIREKIGPVRFFSIDGGHMLPHVAADSRLAMDSLAEHGVIAFDDTFNPAWPEVTVGVADFLRENSETFSAFCMTKYKTYVCRREFHQAYYGLISMAPDLAAFDVLETEFLGSKVARLHNPISRRMVYEVMIRSGLSAFSERVYR